MGQPDWYAVFVERKRRSTKEGGNVSMKEAVLYWFTKRKLRRAVAKYYMMCV